MRDQKQSQGFTACVQMLVGDGGKTIQAAPGAGKALVVTKLIINVTTSAAVVFDVESAGGAVELFKGPASMAVGDYIVMLGDGPGIQLPDNTALASVNAAGVGATFYAEGYTIITALT